MAGRVTLRQLEVLRLMLETGSTTETARLMRISQPAVSKTLQQLQEQFRLNLFERKQGRLIATQEARILARELHHALAAVDGVMRRMDELQDGSGGLLTIAATPTLANTLMPMALARFLPNHRNVRVITNTAMNEAVVESVVDHRADLGLVLLSGDESAATIHELCAADLVCLLPHGHPLVKLDVITPDKLVDQPLVSYSSRQPIGALLDVAYEKLALRRVVAVEVSHSLTACSIVATGGGVAVVDRFALLGPFVPNLVVRPFEPNVRIVARLLHAQHRPLSRAATIFATILRGVVEERIAAGELHIPR